MHGAALHAADGEPPEVRRVVDRGGEHLERALGVARRRGDRLENHVEERREVDGRRVEVERRDAVLGRRVHHRRVELRLVGLELDEERQDLVVHAKRVGAGAVNFVDDDDGRAA